MSCVKFSTYSRPVIIWNKPKYFAAGEINSSIFQHKQKQESSDKNSHCRRPEAKESRPLRLLQQWKWAQICLFNNKGNVAFVRSFWLCRTALKIVTWNVNMVRQYLFVCHVGIVREGNLKRMCVTNTRCWIVELGGSVLRTGRVRKEKLYEEFLAWIEGTVPYILCLGSRSSNRGGGTLVLTEWEDGCAPERCGRFGEESNLLFLPRFEHRIFRSVT